MDPLDQRLTDAGAAWRRSQPEPPDLHRLVVTLQPGRSRIFPPRLGLLFATGLLVLAAIAVAPGVGGILDAFRNGAPVAASATPEPNQGSCPQDPACPSQATATPMASSPAPVTPAPVTPAPVTASQTAPSDAARATALLDSYEAALVAGQWQAAFNMLAPLSPTRQMGSSEFATERAAFYRSVAGRYTIGAPAAQVPDWTFFAPLINGAGTAHAQLIEVDYPALSNNNAGYEQFVVAPDGSGTWWIWPVR